MQTYDRKHYYQTAIRCRSCKGCLNHQRHQLIARVNAAMNKHRGVSWQFVTFTIRLDDDYCDCQFLTAWQKFRRYTLSKSKLPWFRVFERTKKGALHIHLLADSRIGLPLIPRANRYERLEHFRNRLSPEAKKFQDRLCSFGFGPIMNVEKVKSDKAVPAYVAKYVCKGAPAYSTHKDSDGTIHTKTLRHYGASKDFYDTASFTPLGHAVNKYSPTEYKSTAVRPNPYSTGSVMAINMHKRRAVAHYDRRLRSACDGGDELARYLDAKKQIRHYSTFNTAAACEACGRDPATPNVICDRRRDMRDHWLLIKENMYERLRLLGFPGNMSTIDILIRHFGEEHYGITDS